MKKLLLSTLIVLSVTTFSFAQLIGGIRAGLNLANQKVKMGDLSASGDMKPGFQLGLYLTGNVSDKLAVQPELVFSTMGSKDDDVTNNFSYVSIPVLLRYNINEMINIHFG